MGITWLTARAHPLWLWWRKLWKMHFSFHLVCGSTCNFYVKQAHEAKGQIISLLQYRNEKWLGNMRGPKKWKVLLDLVMWRQPWKTFFGTMEWSISKVSKLIRFFFIFFNQDNIVFFLCLGFIPCLPHDRYRNVTKIRHVIHVFLLCPGEQVFSTQKPLCVYVGRGKKKSRSLFTLFYTPLRYFCLRWQGNVACHRLTLYTFLSVPRRL